MTNPYRLVDEYISHETADYLTQLALDAQSGLVVGVAAVVILAGRRYCVNAAGVASRNPTLTLGCIKILDRHVEQLVPSKKDA